MDDKSNNIKELINLVAEGQSLNQKQSENAFDIIMSGEATPSQIGAFLIALRVRGETVDEITGAARIMRAKALLINAPDNAIDIVGTGGDAKGTLNVSTAASFVVAACGVPIAKHGNRALSSKTGAADVLSALGVNIEASFELVKESIWENNIGFLMAPRHHSAMRNVGDVRVELATRTIFNILGPLSNPSQVSRQSLARPTHCGSAGLSASRLTSTSTLVAEDISCSSWSMLTSSLRLSASSMTSCLRSSKVLTNSPHPRPMDRAKRGRFFGPTTTTAIPIIMINSKKPISNIKTP